MKNTITYAILFLSAIAMFAISCSKDKQSENEPTPTPPVDDPIQTERMVLIEMKGGYINWSGHDYIKWYQMEYDRQGRITSMREIDDNEPCRYDYIGSRIIKTDESNDVETFTTDGSVIVRSEWGGENNQIAESCEYNSNNQLIRCSSPNETSILTWTDGNISKVVDYGVRGNEVWTFKYHEAQNLGNLNIALNFAFSTCYPSEVSTPLDYGLSLCGFYGSSGKNLVKEIYVNGEFDRSFEYSDLNAYGYPMTLRIIDDEGLIQQYSLFWKRI